MSINKRKNGNWEVRYRDTQGKHRSKSFKSKRDAIDYERNVIVLIQQGKWTNPQNGKITLESIWDDWKSSKSGLKPKTIFDYESFWHVHINPHFGKYQINSINSRDLQDWVKNAETEGLSTYRRNKALTLLSAVLDYAVDLNLIPKNPARGSSGRVLRPSLITKKGSRPPTSLTPYELRLLAAECKDYEGLILLLGTSGLRWAEAIGLQVKDLDIFAKRITVSKSLSEVSGKFYPVSTKTHKTRVVPVAKEVIKFLVPWTQGKSPEELLFTNSAGNPVSSSNFKNRYYIPALKKLSFTKVTIHDLRHTAASIAVASGANAHALARMLGHASIKMTYDIYSHLFDEDLENVSELMNEAVFNGNVRNMFANLEKSELVTGEELKEFNIDKAFSSGAAGARTQDRRIMSP